jgi:predicted RNA-binding protein
LSRNITNRHVNQRRKPMCEAVVFIVKDGDKKQLMENVVTLHPEGEKILLTDLFGEQKLVTAKIEKVDLTGHEIILSTG